MLVLAAVLGKVHPALPADWGEVMSILGGLLAAWATLFELGGYADTYSGKALHEVLRPIFFRSAFLPGLRNSRATVVTIRPNLSIDADPHQQEAAPPRLLMVWSFLR